MRKIIYTLLLLAGTNCMAQTKIATITGKAMSKAGDTLLLDNGNHIPVKLPVGKDGTFKSTFKIDSGSYYRLNGTPLYLAPQMDLAVNIMTDRFEFTGKGSIENELMNTINSSIKKYLPYDNAALFSKPLDMPAAEFLKQMDEYKTTSVKLLTDTKGLSPYFVKTQKLNIDYIIRTSTSTYKIKYGVDPLVEQEYRQFLLSTISLKPEERRQSVTKIMEYQTKMHVLRMPYGDSKLIDATIWEGFDINNADLYKFSDVYRNMIETKLTLANMAETAKSPNLRSKNPNELKFIVINREVANEYIKQRLLYTLMQQLIRPGDSLTVDYNKYAAVATDAFYKAEITTAYNNLTKYAKGLPSPMFVYNDPYDKPVALSSLKGNYVYMDIWATWCGPCKAEIPSLKLVEEKYANQGIKFVSVSIDEMKDLQTWKNYVNDNRLGGTQVIADNNWKSTFIKNFNINSIPRFILIDPDGKIVSADAPRPSNPELQTLFDKSLAKK